MLLQITPRALLRLHLLAIVLLSLLNAATLCSIHVFDHRRLWGMVWLWNVNREGNIPTSFSALVLLLTGLALLVIAAYRRSEALSYGAWFGLAVLFSFLALDEIGSIHEFFDEPLRERLGTSGLLFYAWVIPYVAVACVLAVIYLPFWVRLPKRTKHLFALGGVLLVGGAVGVESLSGWVDEQYGRDSLTYAMLYSFEEFLEMMAGAVFLFATLDFLTQHCGGLHLQLRTD